MNARIAFVELPSDRFASSKHFYETAFGWRLTDYGPSYSCSTTLGTDIGLQGDASEATARPLAVVEAANLEVALAAASARAQRSYDRFFRFPEAAAFTSSTRAETNSPSCGRCNRTRRRSGAS